jgi:hypothetical protein
MAGFMLHTSRSGEGLSTGTRGVPGWRPRAGLPFVVAVHERMMARTIGCAQDVTRGVQVPRVARGCTLDHARRWRGRLTRDAFLLGALRERSPFALRHRNDVAQRRVRETRIVCGASSECGGRRERVRRVRCRWGVALHGDIVPCGVVCVKGGRAGACIAPMTPRTGVRRFLRVDVGWYAFGCCIACRASCDDFGAC